MVVIVVVVVVLGIYIFLETCCLLRRLVVHIISIISGNVEAMVVAIVIVVDTLPAYWLGYISGI